MHCRSWIELLFSITYTPELVLRPPYHSPLLIVALARFENLRKEWVEQSALWSVPAGQGDLRGDESFEAPRRLLGFGRPGSLRWHEKRLINHRQSSNDSDG